MDRHADGLGARGIDPHLWPGCKDALAHQILEMRELEVNDLLKVNTLPCIVDQKIVVCGERMNACLEPLQEVFRLM